jgi:ribosomal silencing factor RsfS
MQTIVAESAASTTVAAAAAAVVHRLKDSNGLDCTFVGAGWTAADCRDVMTHVDSYFHQVFVSVTCHSRWTPS